MASQPTIDPTSTAHPEPPSGPPVGPAAVQPSVAQPHNYGGSSDARNEIPLPARNKKEPRKFTSPSSASISSAPPLLLGVSNLPFFTNQKLETNTFVPSTIVLFAILAELDANMVNTHRFLQSAPNWIPLISQAYIAVTFLVHVFRVSREANTISSEQFQFLTWFESVYDFRTLMIPGPLVPVYQAIAHVSGPFEWIGNIAPSLTDITRATSGQDFSTRSNAIHILPSIPLIVDQIQWFLSTFNITADNEQFISDNFYSNIFGQAAAAGTAGTHAMLAPHTRHNVSASTQQYKAFKAQANAFSFPPRLAVPTNNVYLDVYEYFRFKPLGSNANTYQWFSTIASTMQRYCQFVRSSVPMSSISLTGLGADIPIWHYRDKDDFPPVELISEQNFKDPQGNTRVQFSQHFRVPPPTSLSAKGYHFDPELEELTEQFSAATQVNVSFRKINQDKEFPTDAQLHVGPAWTLPIIRESPVIDVLPTHGPLIMTHYHGDTRMTWS